MPYLGRTSFLLIGKDNEQRSKLLCQCPISGTLHFYNDFEMTRGQLREVSMPYLGHTSFLQIKMS